MKSHRKGRRILFHLKQNRSQNQQGGKSVPDGRAAEVAPTVASLWQGELIQFHPTKYQVM